MPPISEDRLTELAKQLGYLLKQEKLVLTTAESCTGGKVAEVITRIPGSSNWFERGFVTYSNAAKQEQLGVSQQDITDFGAVSEQVARAMADGALARSCADMSIAVTGIAGPEGGTEEKPVGTVWIAWAMKAQEAIAYRYEFQGNRINVRNQAVHTAISKLIQIIRFS